MFNFNNKKGLCPTDKSEIHNFPFIFQNNQIDGQIHSSSINSQFRKQVKQQQQHATEYLLQISDLGHENINSSSKKFLQGELQANNQFEVDLAPWITTPFRVKKPKHSYKYKTSILSSVENNKKSSHKISKYYNQQPKILLSSKRIESNQCQNKNYSPALENTNQTSLKYENYIVNKIRNYSNRLQQQDQHLQQDQNKISQIFHLKTNKQNQQKPRISTNQKKQKKKGFENQSLDDIMFLKKNHQKNLLKFPTNNSCKRYAADSILRQNTAIINSATQNFGCSQVYQDIICNKSVNSQMQNKKSTNYPSGKLKKQQNSSIDTLFQNLITDFNKKYSQCDQIKHKILQNIQKESVIHQNQQMEINKSKKVFGRYFKVVQQKNYKNKTNKNIQIKMNSNINPNPNINTNTNTYIEKKQNICSTKYQLDNNLGTKQLYDRYRLLINKNK